MNKLVVNAGQESAATRCPWSCHGWHKPEGYVEAYSGRQAVGDFCTVSPTIHGNPSVAPRVGSHCFDSGTCVPVAAVTANYLWKWFAYDWWGNLVQLTTTPCPQIMNTDANLSVDLLPPDALSSVCCRNLHATLLLSIARRCRCPVTNICVTSHTTEPVTGTRSVLRTVEHLRMLKCVLRECKVPYCEKLNVGV
jgi:hypothetical protein